MPIQETLEFKSDEFRRVAAEASTDWLRKEEVKATRKGVLSTFGVGVGVSGAVSTGGVSILYAAYKTRSSYVAWRKLEIIQAELRKRNVKLHKISKSKDILGPVAIGTVGFIVGAEVTDLFDGITGIDQIGALPDDALPSTGLFDNPGEAANGAAGAVEQIFDTITGDAGTAAAIATTDAIAYHAGMVQIQTIVQELGQSAAEKLLFAPGEPSPECRRGNGVTNLSCDNCKAKIPQGPYWHCCGCYGDNYDICDGCYARNIRCKSSKHSMKRLQTPTRADFIDRMSTTPGYSIWKPKAGASTLTSELEKKFLFQCNFCQDEVRQGKIFHCFECGDFDLCDECYLLGKRCDNGHDLTSGLCTIDISDCQGYAVTPAKIVLGTTPIAFATPVMLAGAAVNNLASIFCFSTSCPTTFLVLDTPAPVSESGRQLETSRKGVHVHGVKPTSLADHFSTVANALVKAQTTSTCVCAATEVADTATTRITF
ncbi:hypothetical protein F5Y08DRAFT_352125 [Xylaria arbuscula]|nr:hypothetical protein F5Y08DRAFT_352125 [Xylaria arbuscula]